MGTSSDDFKGALDPLDGTAMVVIIHGPHVPGVAIAPGKASHQLKTGLYSLCMDEEYILESLPRLARKFLP
jgi:hypothetical protein